MLWTDKAKIYLKKYWKIDALKDKQIDAINELLLGNDVIGLLPTGYGKSMCYLIPPLVTKKIMFIISPLISLMDDQKEKLIQMNIPCATLHGNNKNKSSEITDLLAGKIKIVYMSPEYLINSDGLELAKLLVESNQLGFLAVDESHCISSWGHDFRTEYTQIKIIRKEFPHIPIIAVTATATKSVCNDITKLLNLNNPVIIRASFDRPNLYLDVCSIPVSEYKGKTGKAKPKMIQDKKEDIILSFMAKYPNEKIIIYTGSRKLTEEITENINKKQTNCAQAYHAGFSKEEREDVYKKFANGDIKIIISTIAFGMGIDQTVKCIIIFGCPSSIEEYYQQIGRGGRDGKPCETILYFDYGKYCIAQFYLKDITDPKLLQVKKAHLNNINKFANLSTCRRKFILEYFGETCAFSSCNNCDNCCKKKSTKIDIKIDTFEDKISKYEKLIK